MGEEYLLNFCDLGYDSIEGRQDDYSQPYIWVYQNLDLYLDLQMEYYSFKREDKPNTEWDTENIEELKSHPQEQSQQQHSHPQQQPQQSHLKESASSLTSQTDKFDFTANDLEIVDKIYRYFERFTTDEIKKEYGTTYAPKETQKNAFEFFEYNKLEYIRFVKLEKFIARLEEAERKFGSSESKGPSGAVRQFQVQDSSASSAAASSKPDDLFWIKNPEIKTQIIKLADDNPNMLEFNLPPEKLIEKLSSYNLKNAQEIGNVLLSTFKGGYSHSKQQKYLKYKNKYLQLKRLENNSKHSS
jgi:hypothetical protein